MFPYLFYIDVYVYHMGFAKLLIFSDPRINFWQMRNVIIATFHFFFLWFLSVQAKTAKKAVSLGVDGILVSAHGGRQLEGVPAPVSDRQKHKTYCKEYDSDND